MSESNDENTTTENVNTTTDNTTTDNTTTDNTTTDNTTTDNTTTDNVNNAEDTLNFIFSETNVTIVLWFLAIYIVISVALGIFDGSRNINQLSTMVKTIDFAILLVVVGYCLYSYYSLSKEERSEIGTVSTSGLKDFLNDGYSIVYTGIFLGVLYAISYLMKLPMTTSEMPSSLGFLINTGFIVLVLLIIIAVLTNFANIPIVDLIYDGIASLFSVTKEVVEVVEEDREITPIVKDEVFNVSNNLYTYEEAPYVCKALGAKLADYDQVEQAYNNGAEWCNYGWSKDQLALFPTQKDTWKKLHESTEAQSCDKDVGKYKNMCGRPGINGGYIMNPNVKFGVNCYGIKPKAEQSDLDIMNANKDKVLPKSRHQMQTDRKMEFWKENSDKLLTINSFNRDSWSRF